MPLISSSPAWLALEKHWSEIAAIRMRDVVAVHDVPNSPLRLLPGFQQFKAHSYIGAPFSVAGERPLLPKGILTSPHHLWQQCFFRRNSR